MESIVWDRAYAMCNRVSTAIAIRTVVLLWLQRILQELRSFNQQCAAFLHRRSNLPAGTCSSG
jgi:hypothetical protein